MADDPGARPTGDGDLDDWIDPVARTIAAVTCWLHDQRELGRRHAAVAIDVDPVGFVDALACLGLVVGDTAREADVDVAGIIRDIALGVAQARAEDP